MKKPRFIPPEICPVCGEDVPRNARACSECGADEETGWKGDADATGALGLPDEEFDYERFVAEEFGGKPTRSAREWFWWIVAILLLVALLLPFALSVLR